MLLYVLQALGASEWDQIAAYSNKEAAATGAFGSRCLSCHSPCSYLLLVAFQASLLLQKHVECIKVL